MTDDPNPPAHGSGNPTQQAVDALHRLIHVLDEEGERLGATNIRLAIERLEQLEQSARVRETKAAVRK